MRSLFPKTFLVTWIAVGALWADTLHAQVAGFVQVNLVSDIPGLTTVTDPNSSTLGAFRTARRAPSGPRTKGPIAPLSTPLPIGRPSPK